MAGITTEATNEVTTALVLQRGICPIMARMADHRFEADTSFCAWCPDAEAIPAACEQRCRMYEPEREWGLTGGCKLATAANPRYRCTCFMPKGVAWNNAYSAWVARRQRDRARDARIELGRREIMALDAGIVRKRKEVAENA